MFFMFCFVLFNEAAICKNLTYYEQKGGEIGNSFDRMSVFRVADIPTEFRMLTSLPPATLYLQELIA